MPSSAPVFLSGRRVSRRAALSVRRSAYDIRSREISNRCLKRVIDGRLSELSRLTQRWGIGHRRKGQPPTRSAGVLRDRRLRAPRHDSRGEFEAGYRFMQVSRA